MAETPNTVHGRLLEAVHITGYTMERACGELKWLLQEGRWRTVGDGFQEIDAFLETINLAEFKIAVKQRKELAKVLSGLGAGQRDIAKTLGTSAATVNRALKGGAVSNETGRNKKARNVSDRSGASVSSETPALTQSGTAAAKAATNHADKRARREAAEEQRKTDLHRPVAIALAPGLHHGDFRELSAQIEDESVQLVFTDPPYDGDSVPLYGDAARVAQRILKPGGSFIAYSGQRHLPAVLAQCAVHLTYWWTIAGVHGGGNQILNKLGIRCGWKPLVWFVKGTRGDVQNVLADTVSGDREKDAHEWQQSEQEARYFIEKLTTPDGLVVDFFIGGGTTAAAAKALGRKWIGFEVNASSAERASERLESAA